MVSVELVVGYLTLVLIVVTVLVLCCLSCSCHIPLGKCVRCFCDETRRCCRKQTKKLTETETAAQRTKREKEAPVLAGRRRATNADPNEPPCAGCLRGIPWVLTCGYCCGAFGDAFTTNRQLAESEAEAKKRKSPVAVGQPVFEDYDVSEVVGTEHVVAVSIPLLAVS
jgi:hypothetical protein